jgi:hypothetical protein
MEAIDLMGLDIGITELIAPWIGILGTVVIIFLVKDIIYSMIKGLKFKLRPGFEPGDNCYIDGEKATIIRTSMLETVFEIDNGRGKVWRYIPNDELDSIVLERIITPPEDTKKNTKDKIGY